jgi:GNAT superfamily N-acetyltransferase
VTPPPFRPDPAQPTLPERTRSCGPNLGHLTQAHPRDAIGGRPAILPGPHPQEDHLPRFTINGSYATVREFGPGLALLEDLYTPPEESRRGQGRALLAQATQFADDEHRALFLEFSPDPTRIRAQDLRRLYESHGFVRATELTNYRWRWIRSRIGPCYQDAIMLRLPVSGLSRSPAPR